MTSVKADKTMSHEHTSRAGGVQVHIIRNPMFIGAVLTSRIAADELYSLIETAEPREQWTMSIVTIDSPIAITALAARAAASARGETLKP
jgi:hypothetical protein